jgi:hypothetical protein
MREGHYVQFMKTSDGFVERNHISDVFSGGRCGMVVTPLPPKIWIATPPNRAARNDGF